jgi:Mrp family chromosome partitioning ATPase
MATTSLQRQFQEYVQYSEIKHLAYNVAALQQSKMFHTLAVLSCFPEEGKTLLCAALAMAYAEACHTKVLIVDTTSRSQENSLNLRSCFNGTSPSVEIKSLSDIERPILSSPDPKTPVVEPSSIEVEPRSRKPARGGHFSPISRLREQFSRDYGLILLDTTPLHARNKGNLDPLFVARLSEASILVVSKALLNSSHLGNLLKIVKDPSLNLLGVIGNERKKQ